MIDGVAADTETSSASRCWAGSTTGSRSARPVRVRPLRPGGLEGDGDLTSSRSTAACATGSEGEMRPTDRPPGAALSGRDPVRGAGDIDVGVRGGYYFDVDEPFLGAELLMPVGRARSTSTPTWIRVRGRSELPDPQRRLPYDSPRAAPPSVGGSRRASCASISRDRTTAIRRPPQPAGRRRLPRGNLVPYFQAKVIAKEDSASCSLRREVLEHRPLLEGAGAQDPEHHHERHQPPSMRGTACAACRA